MAAATPTEPAESILGSALSGLFEAFMLMTCGALIAIGITLALGGGVAAPVAWLTTLIPAAVLVGMIAGRDMLPAFIYPPTLILGIALLLGWT